MTLWMPNKKRPLYAPMLGSLGGGSARGFGRGGGVDLRAPLLFLYPSEWFSYHGVDPYFVDGDTVFVHSDVNNFAFTSSNVAKISYIEYLVVGGGGATPSDNGGWCSASGGGGGGGVMGQLTGSEMTSSYNITIGSGGTGSTAQQYSSGMDGQETRLELSSNTGVNAKGYGGKGGGWCESHSSTLSNNYSAGGGRYSTLGSNIVGSNGGQGGMPLYDDGLEQATAGSDSAYGGGGGGGASDAAAQQTIQDGGTGQTSVSWVSSSGGDGDGYQNKANNNPTANRGGGAGGFAFSTTSNSDLTVSGAAGFVAFHMVG